MSNPQTEMDSRQMRTTDQKTTETQTYRKKLNLPTNRQNYPDETPLDQNTYLRDSTNIQQTSRY
jgi:hypothetical protein